MGKIIVLDPGHGMGADKKYRRSLLDCSGERKEVK